MHLSHNFKLDKLHSDETINIRTGSGNSRKTLIISSSDTQSLVEWLLELPEDGEYQDIVLRAETTLGIDSEQARELVDNFISAGVLESGTDVTEEALRSEWRKYGWSDAADYHIACRGLAFEPDDQSSSVYRELYQDLLSDPEIGGGQRLHYSPKETGRKLTLESHALSTAIETEHVFERSKPINKFTGAPPDIREVLGAVRDGFGVQKLVDGSLGTHQKRPYPSGGARHPLELYVIADIEENGEYCSYWYDPITHELQEQNKGIDKREIDSACFGKGGVVSSNILLAISCRWMRHAWKYRYSRSYRMILLELGHLVQSLNLNMRARGIDVFQCPSMYDSKWSEILGLPDDGAEGPLYALSLGTNGTL